MGKMMFAAEAKRYTEACQKYLWRKQYVLDQIRSTCEAGEFSEEFTTAQICTQLFHQLRSMGYHVGRAYNKVRVSWDKA